MSLEEDREILRHFWQNQLPCDGFDTTKYKYHAEYIGPSTAQAMYIYQAKLLGYEVIRGDMPENSSIRDEKGECRVGDIVFMRIPLERYKQIERAQNAMNRETMGEMTADQVKRDIDEKMSRLVGHNVSMSFQFRDQRELAQRKAGS